MAGKRPRPDPRVDPHDPDETTPCESCQIDLHILAHARQLEAEQGHARNIMDSLRRESELEDAAQSLVQTNTQYAVRAMPRWLI
jgi:hypothetical protein